MIPLTPSLQTIRKFFEYLPLHVNDISIPLTKHKVCQYFHPSPLAALVPNPTGGPDNAEDHSLNLQLFPRESPPESIPNISLRSQKLLTLITSWDSSQWLLNHPTLPILSLQETTDGSLLQLNPHFICQLITDLYDLQNQSLPIDKYLQFLATNGLDSPSFLIVLYLHHFHVLATNTTTHDTSFNSSHMEFIDWLNSLLPHDNSSTNVFQEEPVFTIKEILIPSEIYPFLLRCFNGHSPLLFHLLPSPSSSLLDSLLCRCFTQIFA
jgi:hypothetical protein